MVERNTVNIFIDVRFISIPLLVFTDTLKYPLSMYMWCLESRLVPSAWAGGGQTPPQCYLEWLSLVRQERLLIVRGDP